MSTYSSWIASGGHADMDYLATDRAIHRRQNPINILPECKSILSLGLRYSPLIPEGQLDEEVRIAAYATGEDYHEVFLKKMENVLRFIEVQLGSSFPYRIYSDTGPILEREIAQMAGLGWIGKNTCLINPQHGSYFLLGEILLGIQLDPDEPFNMDHCGRCSRCVDSCPTEAILPNRTIDSSRCISYLTIENKGPIPPELRNPMGDWIFGCDICQDVCPWNLRFARSSDVTEFQPGEFLRNATIEDFLALTDEAYMERLRRSPLKRAKLTGLLRNAAVSAGNKKVTKQLPLLVNLLSSHPDPLVRSHCAWAIGQLDNPEGEKFLRAALASEEDNVTRIEISAALNLL